MSQAHQHLAKITRIDSVGSRYLVIEARTDVNFVHRPGQYTQVTFEDALGSYQQYYSIASAPRGDGSFELCFNLSDERLRKIVLGWSLRSTFVCTSPAGNFFVPSRLQPLVGIAGGSGITPLKAIIEDRCKHFEFAATTLVYGCQRDDEIPFFESLQNLQRQHPLLQLEIFAEQIPLQRVRQGRPQDFIRPNLETKSEYLLCGPPPFMQVIATHLEDIGVEKSHIHQDRF